MVVGPAEQGSAGDVQRERQRKMVRRNSSQSQLTVTHAQPSADWCRRARRWCTGSCRRPQPGVAHLQQLRSDERGDQHHQQQRGIQVAVENALLQPDGGEDQRDLAAGQHPKADQELVTGTPHSTERRNQLPHRGGDDEQRGIP